MTPRLEKNRAEFPPRSPDSQDGSKEHPSRTKDDFLKYIPDNQMSLHGSGFLMFWVVRDTLENLMAPPPW